MQQSRALLPRDDASTHHFPHTPDGETVMDGSTRTRGFTLIELLIALAIAGILLVVGMPALGSIMARTHRQSAGEMLRSSLAHARELAIVHNVHVIVCPSSDGRNCAPYADWGRGWLIAPDRDHDNRPDAGAPVEAVSAMPEGTHIVASSGRLRVVFHPDGSAGGTNVQLTVCRAGDLREGLAVIVSNVGRVRVDDAQAARLQTCLASG